MRLQCYNIIVHFIMGQIVKKQADLYAAFSQCQMLIFLAVVIVQINLFDNRAVQGNPSSVSLECRGGLREIGAGVLFQGMRIQADFRI